MSWMPLTSTCPGAADREGGADGTDSLSFSFPSPAGHPALSVVGDNIRRIRQSLGLSQEELGRAIGHTGGSYISAIEHGRKYPSDEMLARIGGGLRLQEAGMKPDDLKQPGLDVRPFRFLIHEQPTGHAHMQVNVSETT